MITVPDALEKLSNAMRQCVQRFPIVMGFVAATTIYSLLLIWGDDDWFTENGIGTAYYYLSVGSVLALSPALWSEEVKRRATVLIVQIIAHLLLIADAAYIYLLPQGGFNMEIFLAHAACICSLGLSVFLLSFFRNKDDVPSWNFTLQLAGNGGLCLFIGLIMWGGISLLFLSFEMLFDIGIRHDVYESIALLCCQLLSSLLFLGKIPAGEQKHNPDVYVSDFLSKVMRFLFLPLLGGYLAVLYIYAAKILIHWELPDGWVSWLVTALMTGCIAFEFLIYPTLQASHGTKYRFERQVARLLPLLILPLLLLMTIGICRRINDYGLTLNRLYILTINLWFYAVCIGLFLIRARRIHWIPVSFALLFLLTSALPVMNYAGITHRYLYNKVYEKIHACCKDLLPMTEEQYFDWLISLTKEDALLVNSRLQQLNNVFEDKSIAQVVATTNFWGAEQHIEKILAPKDAIDISDSGSTETVKLGTHILLNTRGTTPIPLHRPINCLYVLKDADFNQQARYPLPDTLRIALPLPQETTPDSLLITQTELKKWDFMSNLSPRKVRCTNPNAHFILTRLSLYFYDNHIKGDLSGHYLINEENTK